MILREHEHVSFLMDTDRDVGWLQERAADTQHLPFGCRHTLYRWREHYYRRKLGTVPTSDWEPVLEFNHCRLRRKRRFT